MTDLATEIKEIVKGEVLTDDDDLSKFSHDASIFEVKPQVVVGISDSSDIQKLVKWVSKNKSANKSLSLSVRAAGTCMSGGSLTDSILVNISKMDRIRKVASDFAIVEPGLYYRDFEREIEKHNLVYPPFPSSKNICAVGGMVGNNAGGEKSLKYGKAEDFVNELKVVFSDGGAYVVRPLTKSELDKKMAQKNFEGEVYKNIYNLVDKNWDLIQKSRPQVSKNSAGYNLFRVWDKKIFDLTKIFVGSQGTLGIITEINFKLLKKIKHRGLLVVYMDSFENIPQIVKTVLLHNPDSFETFDHHTLRLALRYFYGFGKTLHAHFFKLLKEFLPEFINIVVHGMPKLVLLIEYEDDDLAKIHQNLKKLYDQLAKFNNIRSILVKVNRDREKYWAIRRESFNLLRLRVRDKYASPFIDDTIVDPQVLPEFFPKIYKILNDNDLLYTIAGHIGNGNFHIIPLVNIRNKLEVEKIYKVNEQVFDLVYSYRGSHSGEHNDGLIRTPYLKKMYGEKVYDLFVKVKEIFDPLDIFNPGKKVGGDIKFAQKHIRSTW